MRKIRIKRTLSVVPRQGPIPPNMQPLHFDSSMVLANRYKAFNSNNSSFNASVTMPSSNAVPTRAFGLLSLQECLRDTESSDDF